MNTNSESPENQRLLRRTAGINGTQIMFAIILAVGLMLAINFSSRVTADRELRKVRDAVLAEIEALRIEQGELIARLNYVQNDDYVASWARSEGRMVRDGEVLIVPFPSSNTIIPTAEPENTALVGVGEETQTQSWELWWAMFFDSPPPNF